ncbi:uncharacterized protein LOC109715327 [Ananas comosus]|uniref:Uncharacterized protein LOC109715327 n=1 Tax=Ananas comosus TaxID=4615 RepID=A0A6P5FJP0_ANACO|nr:uncharacterized protein LOC109715327 [Ananas comosus]
MEAAARAAGASRAEMSARSGGSSSHGGRGEGRGGVDGGDVRCRGEGGHSGGPAVLTAGTMVDQAPTAASATLGDVGGGHRSGRRRLGAALGNVDGVILVAAADVMDAASGGDEQGREKKEYSLRRTPNRAPCRRPTATRRGCDLRPDQGDLHTAMARSPEFAYGMAGFVGSPAQRVARSSKTVRR